MILILLGIIILLFGTAVVTNKVKYTEINNHKQNYNCVPQPIILKNGQVIFAKININYHIINSKKAKKAFKNGINIYRKLEYEGTTELRKCIDEIDVMDTSNIKIENKLKNKLSVTEQELGIEIIELDIKFLDKKELAIENKSYNPIIKNIGNTNNEEIIDAKYTFDVSMKTIFGKHTSRNTDFNTKIDIQNDKLKYQLHRKYENSDKWLKNGDRKYHSFTEGRKEIYIDDIISIKYKTGFTFALNFFDFVVLLCAIFGILFPIFGQLSFWRSISSGLEKNPISFNYMPSIIYLFATILFICYFTCKCIEIKYNENEKIKKVIFPISRTFFFSVPNGIKKQVNALIEEIRQKTQNIKLKKDRLKWVLISYIIIASIIYVSVPVYLRQKYLQDNELSYNINNDLVYCNVSFDKGKIVDITNKKDGNGNLISKYVFQLTNGKKIEIEGYNKEHGKTYNICTENYYKVNTNKLFKTNYLVRDNSDVMTVLVQGVEYVYDYIGDKTFKFNSLNNDNIIDFETKIYYREIGNANTLYNFINYGKNRLSITDDFDVKEFKRNNYETIEKIGTYMSEYGMCYILKANYNGKADYLMYVENKDKNNIDELDGILLNSHVDRTGSFENSEDATRAFKTICPEK